MNQKAVRSWITYDWANSVFVTIMVAAVLPIFYADVATKGLPEYLKTSYWGYTQTIAMIIVALSAPLLGSIADLSGYKVRFLRIFCYMGVLASAAFVFVGEGNYILASILMIVGTIGFSGGNTFYDSLLVDLVPEDKRDMVSSKGFSYGYLGGGLLLAVSLMMIMTPTSFGLANTLQGIYITFIMVAVWWFVFSIPIFRHVGPLIAKPEVKQSFSRYTSDGTKRLIRTIKRVRHYPELFKYLIAFWLFNDGINTVIVMATIYGNSIGIGTTHLITALLITQFVGFPCTLLFGRLAEKLGPKNSLYISLSMYVVIISLGYFMETAMHFYALAIMVGMVQGGSQAVARSIFSRLVPKRQSAEFFGFLSVSSKLSSSFGPFVFGVVAQMFQSSRLGILALLFFIIGGMAVLTKVDLSKGRQQALDEDSAFE